MMSLHVPAIFHATAVVLFLASSAGAVYEQNPFLQQGGSKQHKKDLNQINLAVIVPPGGEPYFTVPGKQPPSPPAPGYVWVQVPLSNTPINDNKHYTMQPLTSVPGSPVTQPTVPSTTGEKTTKEPLFTIEPPEILYGGDLNRFCLQPKGQFPSKSCNKYVNCWDGVAIEQTCPEGLLFSPSKLYCDYSQNVDCQGKTINIDPTPTAPQSVSATLVSSNPFLVSGVTSSPELAVTPSSRKFCLRSTGLFPGSTCSKFVNCWADNAVEQDCPEGLFFSSEGYCDYPQNVNCGRQDDKQIPESFFSSLEPQASTQKSDCPLEFGTFRERSNCSQYYTCAYHKVAARYDCPEGLSFSDVLGLCDYSYRVDCSKEPQIFQRKTDSTIQDVIAQVQNCTPGTVFRLNPQCTSACRCRDGVAEIIQCPSGLVYDIQLDKCLPSHLARC